MGTVFAFMTGIELYRDAGVSRLYGCRADIADATAALSARLRGTADLRVRELIDDDATRDAVIDGFRTHLGQATSDDTAVFWFSGHGSYAQVPRQLWHLEPDGRTIQTLVCSDSRVDGRPDLLDKELGLLLDEVADRGCHVLVVLDSCHSGGATRGHDIRGGDIRARAARPSTVGSTEHLLPGLVAHYASLPAGAPPQRHVTLSACRSFETAMEQPLDGGPRGVFSWALTRALRRAGAQSTYRDLLALTRTEMDALPAYQRPQLAPAGRGLGDQPIFGGPARMDGPAVTMRWARDGWQVNAGAAHGIGGGRRATVIDRGTSREVRLSAVAAEHSLAEPIGWHPDPHRVYRLALTAAPLAAVTVTIDRDAPAALAEYLPPSSVTVTDDAELTISADPAGGLRLTSPEDMPIRRWPAGTAAAPIAREVAHIARWRQVWQLSNPRSGLRGRVTVELVEPLRGETIAPPDRDPVVPDADGVIRLAHGRPHFVRIRNDGPLPLHCVLLTLTDTFAVSAALFPGATVAARSVAAAAEGAPVEFSHTRAWLKLVVTRDDLDADPYELPPIGEVWRDVRRVAAQPSSDWWTTTVPLTRGVPHYEP